MEYRPHWSKPPLTYWAIASGILLIGRNELGVRLYGAVAWIIAIGAVVWLGTLTEGIEVGYLAGLIYATSPLTILGSNAVSADMPLALWELLAVLAYWAAVRSLEGHGRRSRRWIIGMWAFLGLAFLTKGYPALLALLVILVFHITGRRRGADLPRLLEPAGLLLFVFVGFSWFIAVTWKDPGLLTYYWREEFVARLTTEHFHRNPEWYKPFVIYLPGICLGLGPWSYYWIKTLKDRGAWQGEELAHAVPSDVMSRRFLRLWLIIPLAILFLSRSRLLLYILPFFPPVSLMVASLINRRLGLTAHRRSFTQVAAVTALLMIAAKGIIARIPVEADMRPLYRAVAPSGRPQGPVFLVDEGKHYGLWFYLDGDIERVTSGVVHGHGTRDLGTVLHELPSGPGAPTTRFILKEKNRAAIDILEGSGKARRVSKVDGYIVYAARW